MPENQNPWVADLLAWHGHAAGGVHVPFQARGNPIGRVIATGLVRRLLALADDIASSPVSRPRWVFLVGGPGNGKSEAVQAFLARLDTSLNIGGSLVDAISREFSRPGLLPRKVEILSQEFSASSSEFSEKVGRLVVVQDATATDTATGNAAKELADDLADLLTSPPLPPLPVFIVCANRGLLARSMYEAVLAFGEDNEVTRLLANVIQASSLGLETLEGRKQCWPLESDERFACWPLDVESLLTPCNGPPPLDLILADATASGQWDAVGRCQDCTSRSLCPFRQSAEWLQDGPTKSHLLTLLRRGELARGQRWSFRDSFSLVAELLVGQWSDFQDSQHPCQWVHEKYAAATAIPPDASAALALATQLYPSAMFRGGRPRQAAAAFVELRALSPQSHPLTHKLITGFATLGTGSSSKPIRDMLLRDYSRLDPAASTPRDPAHVLRQIEEAFCQSVEQGRSELQKSSPSAAEDLLLSFMEKAEEEWDLLGRESSIAIAAVCLIRRLSSVIAKRSAGMRLGHHALDDLLGEYDASLRDPVRLAGVRSTLQSLLGEAAPRFNLLEILGQPTAEDAPLVSLQGSAPGIRPIPAPLPTASTPGHDMPCIEFTNPMYRVPLTFEFYWALRLRREGCAGSSLPASVRAALDRIRHRIAGGLCRDDEFFVDGRASIALASGQRITVPAAGASPALAPE